MTDSLIPKAKRRKWKKEAWKKLREEAKPVAIALSVLMATYAVYKISKSIEYGHQEWASEKYQVERLKW